MSPNEVFTKATCDICNKVNERRGAERQIPPIDWAEAELTYRLKGCGWTNYRQIVKTLCPECATKVEDVLRSEK